MYLICVLYGVYASVRCVFMCRDESCPRKVSRSWTLKVTLLHPLLFILKPFMVRLLLWVWRKCQAWDHLRHCANLLLKKQLCASLIPVSDGNWGWEEQSREELVLGVGSTALGMLSVPHPLDKGEPHVSHGLKPASPVQPFFYLLLPPLPHPIHYSLVSEWLCASLLDHVGFLLCLAPLWTVESQVAYTTTDWTIYVPSHPRAMVGCCALGLVLDSTNCIWKILGTKAGFVLVMYRLLPLLLFPEWYTRTRIT